MRYYDPNLGRYITPDPIGLAGGMNPYIYTGGDPVDWVDPWGLMTQDITPWDDWDNIYEGGGAGPGFGSAGGGALTGLGIAAGVGHYLFGDDPESYINEDGTVRDKPAVDDTCEEKGKWKCEGYGQYDQIGTPKHVRRGSTWHVAYGNTEALAAQAWKNKVQAAAPPGFTARHIKPRCKKVK